MGRKNILAVIGFALAIALLPRAIGEVYYLSILIFIGIYCLITLGLSLLMGYAGQISLGHAAFYGIGAYTSGLLTTRLGWNSWLAMAAAVALSGALAWLVGRRTLRLTGHYLAMATLALGMIVYVIFEAWVGLTGGPSGFGSIPRLKVGALTIKTELQFYYLVWGCVLATLVLSLHIVHSRIGRALRAIHGSETAARAMGVNTAQYKIQVFVLSACLAALAGSLYAHYVTFISPTTFDFKFSVTLLTMVAVGGMANLWGAMAGTALLAALPEYLKSFDQYYLLIYGGILIGILLFMPQGLIVALGQALERAMDRVFGRGKSADAQG